MFICVGTKDNPRLNIANSFDINDQPPRRSRSPRYAVDAVQGFYGLTLLRLMIYRQGARVRQGILILIDPPPRRSRSPRYAVDAVQGFYSLTMPDMGCFGRVVGEF